MEKEKAPESDAWTRFAVMDPADYSPHPATSYSAHAQQAGHVGVMAAGVHDWDGVSILVNGGIGGGVI